MPHRLAEVCVTALAMIRCTHHSMDLPGFGGDASGLLQGSAVFQLGTRVETVCGHQAASVDLAIPVQDLHWLTQPPVHEGEPHLL